MDNKLKVVSTVKDEGLIEIRRKQVIQGAVKLFKEKGFHRTTTREIAREAGFSIGTLYEYIRTKEDILYLVCDSIYLEVRNRLAIFTTEGTMIGLKSSIQEYYRLIDELSDEFVVMYQESKSLSKEALHYVLEKEMEMVSLFSAILQSLVKSGELTIQTEAIDLLAHHIVVQGQMWAFRRWALGQAYTIDQYIDIQTEQLLLGLVGKR